MALAVVVRSQQPQCLLGQWQDHGCWLWLQGHRSLSASEASGRLLAAAWACDVTAASVLHRPVAGPLLLPVLVRLQKPQCLIGQFEANDCWVGL